MLFGFDLNHLLLFPIKDTEWWPIFKQNWGGFVVAMAILYGLTIVMSFAMQFLLITIVLICVLPLFMPVFLMYYSVIQFALSAQAYKDGEEKLALELSSPAPLLWTE